MNSPTGLDYNANLEEVGMIVYLSLEQCPVSRPNYQPAAFAIAASTAFWWMGGIQVVDKVFMMVGIP